MNFTLDIKKELITHCSWTSEKERKAALSAFVRTSGTLGIVNQIPTFFLVSQTERVAEFFMTQFVETYGFDLTLAHASQDRLSGRDKLVLECPLTVSKEVLSALGLLKRGANDFRDGISRTLLHSEQAKIAYIQGAFLGGGSCILPTEKGGGYHLETVFFDKKTAQDFCDLLGEFELIARLVERKENFVVYIKSKELISDFLSIVGAENTLKKFAAFIEKRDEANHDNRARNCFSGNADKTAIAAVKQVVALKKMQEKNDFNDLSEELRTLARARLKNPTMSLRELAEYLGESKSCLNHRMRRLMSLAEE